jgi:TonB family protein
LLRVDIKSGLVKQVIVGHSTGSSALDAAAVKAFSRWRFKPGILPQHQLDSVHFKPPLVMGEAVVKMPVTFAL